MSAHDQMRAMLDQLMGTSRNGDDTRYRLKFSDPKVCKSFLLTCCPHEILSSTRMDLGECPKVHDLALRADYEQASAQKDYFYDIDAMEHLQSFITDCDRRTESAKKRLAETQEELSAEVAAKANKVHDLAEQIGKKLAKAEGLGADGMVEESMKLMEEVEDLRKRKAAAEQEYRNSMPASSYQQQKLRVCEVCSAYLGIHDNDRRLADHFGGKLHLGFIKIREKLEELKKTVESRREKRREERELERNARFGEIADYDVTRDHDRDRERYRESDRDRRERYREGDRERRRRRSRSRTRSRERRRRRSRSRVIQEARKGQDELEGLGRESVILVHVTGHRRESEHQKTELLRTEHQKTEHQKTELLKSVCHGIQKTTESHRITYRQKYQIGETAVQRMVKLQMIGPEMAWNKISTADCGTNEFVYSDKPATECFRCYSSFSILFVITLLTIYIISYTMFIFSLSCGKMLCHLHDTFLSHLHITVIYNFRQIHIT
ncbi:putative RNA-binding protein Luc7-like 1 isoform X2 [Procambarus clarkii]|uniref:putative RNA-binding protein Luc7-like 1 isoform X2 n=1 Tax=Procambarus clarkii TaxID=6728 RepID=UPI001E671D32|nr:putative RNA-binding protein Luc7-like 1 isoform X1 [Procambarus clarkii]